MLLSLLSSYHDVLILASLIPPIKKLIHDRKSFNYFRFFFPFSWYQIWISFLPFDLVILSVFFYFPNFPQYIPFFLLLPMLFVVSTLFMAYLIDFRYISYFLHLPCCYTQFNPCQVSILILFSDFFLFVIGSCVSTSLILPFIILSHFIFLSILLMSSPFCLSHEFLSFLMSSFHWHIV